MNHSLHKISLFTAILININVMIGTGIFINTIPLARMSGGLGVTSYLIVGIIIMPLALAIAQLLATHPLGGFYTFGSKELHPIAGFISAWSYFTGKLASSILIIHVAVGFLQETFSSLQMFNHFTLDIGILFLFLALNLLHIRLGSLIQTIFVIFKSIPIITAIIIGFALFTFKTVDPVYSHSWQGIPFSIPIILHALIGFEAACSLSSHIHNSKRNAPIAVLLSCSIVIAIASIYQLAFYSALGESLTALAGYQFIFPALLQPLSGLLSIAYKPIIAFLQTSIALSALGSSYSIIFSNMWNLYALAENRHTFFPKLVAKFNKNNIPWLCVLAQGAICIMYLIVTRGSQLPLQQISALSSTIAYTISMISFYRIQRKEQKTPLLSVIGLLSCITLLSFCLYSFVQHGASALILFTALIAFGISMFWATITQTNVS